MEPNKNWSTTLFLRINQSIGRFPLIDRLMVAAADNLVFILVLVSLLWATTYLQLQDPLLLGEYLKLMMTAFAFGIGLSWMIGWVIPNPRPIRSFPRIQQLMTPISTWKSFPSDHTIGSFTVATVTMIMGAPWSIVVLLYILAGTIAFARVYVGVHYPRDIVGGFFIGMVFSFASPALLMYITEPIYIEFMKLFV
jgi:undecaprenyl-diphosphatase